MKHLPEIERKHLRSRIIPTWRVLGYKCPCGSMDITGSLERLHCACGRWWFLEDVKNLRSEAESVK